MTPEELFETTVRALTEERWDKGTACATAGLLSLMIGAMKALRDATWEQS